MLTWSWAALPVTSGFKRHNTHLGHLRAPTSPPDEHDHHRRRRHHRRTRSDELRGFMLEPFAKTPTQRVGVCSQCDESLEPGATTFRALDCEYCSERCRVLGFSHQLRR